MPVMVLIADGDAAGRAMARRTIEGVVQVVGEATNDEEAMRLAQELMPDVILIDIDLPRGGGVPFTHRLKALQPRIKVILTTGHE
jgi:DNA-binding NarL/FixJ family response regulator